MGHGAWSMEHRGKWLGYSFDDHFCVLVHNRQMVITHNLGMGTLEIGHTHVACMHECTKLAHHLF